jgi:triphosphoribosyl-dephospho-CoA synthase
MIYPVRSIAHLVLGFFTASKGAALNAADYHNQMRTAREIAQLAQMACVWEACAPKPGNVNRIHDFSDTSLDEFVLSAIAIGPAFEKAADLDVGQLILQATKDTRRLVRSNTNLGMILLLSPLVKACVRKGAANVRRRLRAVLNSLTVQDARLTYAAIRLANPGGLGRVPKADVAGRPSITLLEAMALAQDRDSVAREYVTGFSISFEIGAPALKEARSRGTDFSGAVVQAFLAILSRVPDTLIARKKGPDAARQVSDRASEVLNKGGVLTSEGRMALADFDGSLRDPSHTLNPGTTADLTAAAIFLTLLEAPEMASRQSAITAYSKREVTYD